MIPLGTLEEWFIFSNRNDCIKYSIIETGLWDQPVDLGNGTWKIRRVV